MVVQSKNNTFMNNLDYGIIGNCRTAALVSKTGSIDWFCLPDFDSPSIFAKLLDKEKGGSFHFEVSDDYEITQKYNGHTNILMTRFESPEHGFIVFDYMPRYRTSDLRHYMPPEIHRYIRVIKGSPTLRVIYDPKINYAREEVRHEIVGNYIKTHSVGDSEEKVYLYTSFDMEKVLNRGEIVITENQFFLLSYNQNTVYVYCNQLLIVG